MTTKNTAQRPLWADYKSAQTTTQPSKRWLSNGGLLNKKRNKPVVGAVRLSDEPPPRFQHFRKVSFVLTAIATSILFTTSSTGTVEKQTLSVTPQAPKPQMMSVITPTFFFDDAEDALGTQQQLLNSDLASEIAAKAKLAQLAQRPQAINPLETVISEMDALTPAKFNEGPETVTLSSLVNHPTAAAVRQNAEFPTGAVEEEVVVQSGDTLSRLLNERGVKIDQMPQLLTDEVVKKYLSNLRIGQKFSVTRLSNGDFHSLTAKVGKDRRVSIRRSSSGFAVASIDLPVEKERVVTSGTIEQSLYIAAEQANLKQSTIMELADIFQWELDFARDIRKGDHFSLIYDRLYREGKYIGDGDILAAEFVRGGNIHRAIRYTDPTGKTDYYTPDGKSKRRAFLRHPVDVVRITSRFDPKRVHPVLHQIRAHRGVDYGSPTGTPIRATSNGTVSFAGNKNAYGKTVILKHGKDISTLYAHMSRISKKVSHGKRVKQGDVIGYVGATGRVTGAHLHYEFRKNGKHVDPLKVELPEAQPLAAEYKDSLRDLSNDLLTQMRSVLPAGSDQVATR